MKQRHWIIGSTVWHPAVTQKNRNLSSPRTSGRAVEAASLLVVAKAPESARLSCLTNTAAEYLRWMTASWLLSWQSFVIGSPRFHNNGRHLGASKRVLNVGNPWRSAKCVHSLTFCWQPGVNSWTLQDLAAVLMNIHVFWNGTPYRLVITTEGSYLRNAGNYFSSRHGVTCKKTWKWTEQTALRGGRYFSKCFAVGEGLP